MPPDWHLTKTFFFRIFEYMTPVGRPKKYTTEEEAKAAMKEKSEQARLARLEKAGRNSVSHPMKHKKFYQDGVKVDIGTLDRTRLDTAYIDMMVTTTYTNDKSILSQFKDAARETFRGWLDFQDMWDRKHYIFLMEYDEIDRKYNGKNKTFSLQFHLRRNTTSTWNEMVENLSALVSDILDSLKKTCQKTGLELHKWKPGNPNGRRKKTELPDDARPETTKENAG